MLVEPNVVKAHKYTSFARQTVGDVFIGLLQFLLTQS
jgi:hypothetical protein